jgi:hypothetical protein
MREREFQGAGPGQGDESCPTGSCQETTMSYDGHGRMSARKYPIESAASSLIYNVDDTLQTMTDARGVTTTYGYNNRHLTTSITYGTAPNVIPLNPVTFGYDEVGNRLWMDDQPGRVDYQYNTLSQMEWEERRFDDLTQAYRLSYEYNLAGQMKMVAGPWNKSNTYVFNKAGEITDVTGTGYRDNIPPTNRVVSQFATGIKYRAWGAIKSFTNGNFTEAEKKNFSMNYNSRLQLTHYDSGGRITDHTYHNDGRVKDVIDSTYSNFNRIHNYDHVGRLISANATNPFSYVYAYDVWDHVTSRNGHHWGQPLNFTASYMNDRDQALTYDQAGNVTFTGSPIFATIQYDSASRQASRRSRPPDYLVDVIITKSYDGDGELVRTTNETVPPSNILRQYLLRSTVMKGAVIVYIHPGVVEYPSQTNIYLHEEQIAYQRGVGDEVVWDYRNPITRSYYAHNRMDRGGPIGQQDTVFDEVVVDPTGADVGITNPYIPQPPPASDPAAMGMYTYYANPTNFGVGCTVDGLEVPCDEALRYVNMGIAQLDPSRSNLGALMSANGIIPIQNLTYQPGENGEPGGYEVGIGFRFVQPKSGWIDERNAITGDNEQHPPSAICRVSLGSRGLNYPGLKKVVHHMFVTTQTLSTDQNISQSIPTVFQGTHESNYLRVREGSFQKGNQDYDNSRNRGAIFVHVEVPGICDDVNGSFRKTMNRINDGDIEYQSPIIGINGEYWRGTKNSNAAAYTLLQNWSSVWRENLQGQYRQLSGRPFSIFTPGWNTLLVKEFHPK